MKKNTLAFVALGVLAALAGVALAVATTATATHPNNSGAHVTICHATGSESNPYVQISPDAEGVISGHVGAGHQNGEDIIPPFDYYADGVLTHFAGQNWDVSHEAIYFNGCELVGSTTTTTETQPPPTQTVTVTTPGPTTTVPTPGPSSTVTVTTPGPTTTVTTPGKTRTVTKVVKRAVVKKVHVKTTSARSPKTTG